MFTQQPTFPEQKLPPERQKLGHSGSSEILVACDAGWPQTLYLWTSSVKGLCMVNLHGSGLSHGAAGPVVSVRWGGDEWSPATPAAARLPQASWNVTRVTLFSPPLFMSHLWRMWKSGCSAAFRHFLGAKRVAVMIKKKTPCEHAIFPLFIISPFSLCHS